DQQKYVIKGYERTVNGKVFKFDAEEVFYLKYFNSQNPIRGMSPLFPARHSAASDLNATFYTKQFFRQGARPSGMLTTEQKLTEPEQRRLEEYIKKKYQSVDQMQEILVMWGGLDFKPLNTMNMTDMQFKDLKMMDREEIIIAFGLSLEVLGLGQKTFENVQFYRRLAWTETLQPLMDKFLALLNKNIAEGLYQIEGLTVEADYSNVEALREERAKKVIDFERGFKMGAITPNETREIVFGLDPINIPEMDVTYLHLNVANPVDLPDIQQPDQAPAAAASYVALTGKGLTYEDRTKIWWSYIKKYEEFEPPFEKMISKIFDDMNKDLNKKVPALFKSIKVEEEGPTIPPSLILKIKKLFDEKFWAKRIAKDSTPLIVKTMESVANDLLKPQ
ncbi:MAG: phage portal protein, partial [Candidatus Heimdallarchaeota archaeon]|nr:phage portal protein [Candidatus Heimdallarchaeota archaeon]